MLFRSENRLRICECAPTGNRAFGRAICKSLCFVGPPGTGKTSIAEKVVAPYLYGIGLLDRPTTKLVTVDDLQTSHGSHASKKVKGLFHSARGGVLVIEKADNLSADNIYGADAIRALATEATNSENRRTLIILEGHEEEIDDLISRNPGLESRFNRKIVFEPMPAKSLLKIMREACSAPSGRGWRREIGRASCRERV